MEKVERRERMRENAIVFKRTLDRIAERYSKLADPDGGAEVDLLETNMKDVGRHMAQSKIKLSRIESKRSPDLTEHFLTANDTTSDTQLDRWRHEADESRVQGMVQDEMSGVEDNQFSLDSLPQPEDYDADLEKTLSLNSTSLKELYPSMMSQLWEARRREHVSNTAASVLQRYRRMRRTNDQVKKTGNDKPHSRSICTKWVKTSNQRHMSNLCSPPAVEPQEADCVQKDRPVLVLDFSGSSATSARSNVSQNQTFVVSQELAVPERLCHPPATQRSDQLGPSSFSVQQLLAARSPLAGHSSTHLSPAAARWVGREGPRSQVLESPPREVRCHSASLPSPLQKPLDSQRKRLHPRDSGDRSRLELLPPQSHHRMQLGCNSTHLSLAAARWVGREGSRSEVLESPSREVRCRSASPPSPLQKPLGSPMKRLHPGDSGDLPSLEPLSPQSHHRLQRGRSGTHVSPATARWVGREGSRSEVLESPSREVRCHSASPLQKPLGSPRKRLHPGDSGDRSRLELLSPQSRHRLQRGRSGTQLSPATTRWVGRKGSRSEVLESPSREVRCRSTSPPSPLQEPLGSPRKRLHPRDSGDPSSLKLLSPQSRHRLQRGRSGTHLSPATARWVGREGSRSKVLESPSREVRCRSTSPPSPLQKPLGSPRKRLHPWGSGDPSSLKLLSPQNRHRLQRGCSGTHLSPATARWVGREGSRSEVLESPSREVRCRSTSPPSPLQKPLGSPRKRLHPRDSGDPSSLELLSPQSHHRLQRGRSGTQLSPATARWVGREDSRSEVLESPSREVRCRSASPPSPLQKPLGSPRKRLHPRDSGDPSSLELLSPQSHHKLQRGRSGTHLSPATARWVGREGSRSEVLESPSGEVRYHSASPLQKPLGSPRKRLHPGDSGDLSCLELLSPQSHHRLQRGRSLESPFRPSGAALSPAKVEDDFLKRCHQFVCLSGPLLPGAPPCRYCSGDWSLESSRGCPWSSLAALALSPHRSVLKKRLRELDQDRTPQSKRLRDWQGTCSPGSLRHVTERLDGQYPISPLSFTWVEARGDSLSRGRSRVSLTKVFKQQPSARESRQEGRMSRVQPASPSDLLSLERTKLHGEQGLLGKAKW